MKFSYQWLRELSGTERTPEALADLLMMHAFEVEELEHVGFESEAVVVGEVVGLEPHPNADKLRVAQVNVGEEVYGKGEASRRPVVIFKKLSGNSCIAIPTTTKTRNGSWFHHLHIKDKDRWVMMNQMRFLSANRLWVRESSLSSEEFSALKKSVAELLGLS